MLALPSPVDNAQQPNGVRALRRVKFIQPWGHPTRNQICGTGEIYKVPDDIARILESGGYVEFLQSANAVESQPVKTAVESANGKEE